MSMKDVLSHHADRRELFLRGSRGIAGLAALYTLYRGVPWLVEATREPTRNELLAAFYPESEVVENFAPASFRYKRTDVQLYDVGDRIDIHAFEELYRFVASINRETFALSYMGDKVGATIAQADQDYYLFFFGKTDIDSKRPKWVRDGVSDTVRRKLRLDDVTVSFVPVNSYPEETVGEELARGLFDLRFGRDVRPELKRLFSDITAMSFGAGVAAKNDQLLYADYRERMGWVEYIDPSTQKNHPSVIFSQALYNSIPVVTLTK